MFGVLLVCLSAGAEVETDRPERRQWRVSVGASVIGPVRASLGAKAATLSALSRFSQEFRSSTTRRGRSREEAYAAGAGTADPNGVRRFDGDAWYDPVDSASANDSEWSWNWRLHDPQGLDAGGYKGFTEYTAYSEISEVTTMEIVNGGGVNGDSSEWFPGLRVELARELYVSEDERPWGVDFAVAFAYYFRKGLWKADGTAATGAINGRQNEGYYEWWNDSGDTAQYILDYERETQFHDGLWGAGSFDGPGAELANAAWQYREVATGAETWSSAQSLRYHGEGDYREYSIELLARPWWEPWERVRLFGSIGLEISHRAFKWSMEATDGAGAWFSERGKEEEWRLLGLVGGGLAVSWHDFTLAGEALYRFGGEDLDVVGQSVSGHITSGEWGFRLSLGYSF